jgi:hypothetical protein
VTDNCSDVFNPGQENQDGDLLGDVCDCAPTDGTVHAVPGDVLNLAISDNGVTIITWDSQGFSSGFGTVYDVATQTLSDLHATGSFAAATCLEDDRTSPASLATAVPPVGEGYLYLVRAENSCGDGSYGTSSVQPDPRAALDLSGVCP